MAQQLSIRNKNHLPIIGLSRTKEIDLWPTGIISQLNFAFSSQDIDSDVSVHPDSEPTQVRSRPFSIRNREVNPTQLIIKFSNLTSHIVRMKAIMNKYATVCTKNRINYLTNFLCFYASQCTLYIGKQRNQTHLQPVIGSAFIVSCVGSMSTYICRYILHTCTGTYPYHRLTVPFAASHRPIVNTLRAADMRSL